MIETVICVIVVVSGLRNFVGKDNNAFYFIFKKYFESTLKANGVTLSITFYRLSLVFWTAWEKGKKRAACMTYIPMTWAITWSIATFICL